MVSDGQVRVSLSSSIYIRQPPHCGPPAATPLRSLQPPPFPAFTGPRLPFQPGLSQPSAACKSSMHGGKPVGCEGCLSDGQGEGVSLGGETGSSSSQRPCIGHSPLSLSVSLSAGWEN